ncbi:hypothetical protein PIB30_043905 [Stylosanthes scabra]|uniref:Uncharacterized protein n=1 Tax=Stylosanthes scabra TaxID=79078 RepID=A0ABU6UEC3_9FABA|nr:hypothetical protein [Stylosanthes scabra]
MEKHWKIPGWDVDQGSAPKEHDRESNVVSDYGLEVFLAREDQGEKDDLKNKKSEQGKYAE